MSLYAYDRYAENTYGISSGVEYSVAPFRAVPASKDLGVKYEQLQVRWTVPVGNWTSFRLLKNRFGFANTPLDGEILIDAGGSPPNAYVDNEVKGGQFVYYAIWLDTAANGWQRVGTAMGLPVSDHDYSNRLYDLLPEAVRAADQRVLPNAPESEREPLKRFLKVFSYPLDLLQTEYATLLNIYDADEASAGLIRYLAQQFGMPYEPEMGVTQQRRLTKNAVRIYRLKGTKLGVEALVTSYSGWAAEATVGYNRMLSSDYDIWVGTNTTSITEGASPEDTSIKTIFVEADGGGDAEIAAAQAGTERSAGIVVTANAQYSFSCQSRADSTGRTVTLEIDWYEEDGTFISTTSEVGAANVTGSWTSYAINGATSPALSARAVVKVVIGGPAAAEKHHVRYAQFEDSATASAYQHPRKVLIDLEADRLNEILNPAFDNDAADWFGNYGLARVTTDPFIRAGHAEVENTSGATNDLVLRTASGVSGIAVSGDLPYTASMYVQPETTASARTCWMEMTWYDSGGSVISTDTGTSITSAVSEWTRMHLTATSPSNAAFVEFRAVVQATPNLEKHWLDAALLEQGSSLESYFDGDTDTPPTDYLWEGTAGNSRSHYYRARAFRDNRLRVVVPTYLPPDRDVEFSYAS